MCSPIHETTWSSMKRSARTSKMWKRMKVRHRRLCRHHGLCDTSQDVDVAVVVHRHFVCFASFFLVVWRDSCQPIRDEHALKLFWGIVSSLHRVQVRELRHCSRLRHEEHTPLLPAVHHVGIHGAISISDGQERAHPTPLTVIPPGKLCLVTPHCGVTKHYFPDDEHDWVVGSTEHNAKGKSFDFAYSCGLYTDRQIRMSFPLQLVLSTTVRIVRVVWKVVLGGHLFRLRLSAWAPHR